MKIRNENKHLADTDTDTNADTIQSILYGNQFGIHQIAANSLSSRRHLISFKRENHSKYCIILNLWNADRQHRSYLLYKLTQLCLIIVLLLPFLITITNNKNNALMQQVSAEYAVIDPKSTLSTLNRYKNNFINQSTFQVEYNKLKFNDNKTNQINLNKYSTNNQYRLIILSQFAYHLNSKETTSASSSSSSGSGSNLNFTHNLNSKVVETGIKSATSCSFGSSSSTSSGSNSILNSTVAATVITSTSSKTNSILNAKIAAAETTATSSSSGSSASASSNLNSTHNLNAKVAATGHPANSSSFDSDSGSNSHLNALHNLNNEVAATRDPASNSNSRSRSRSGSNFTSKLSPWIRNVTSIRTKRFIDTNREINHKKHEANNQILKLTFEQNKNDNNDNDNDNDNNDNNVSKQIIKNQDKITKLVMSGLGLKKLPDMKKANISQIEYSSKYLEYLERLRKRELREKSEDQIQIQGAGAATSLQILSIVTNKFKDITRKRWRWQHHKRAARSTENSRRRRGNNNQKKKNRNLDEGDRTNILLHFPLRLNDEQFNYEQINEANVRLMMLYNPALADPTNRFESHRKQSTIKNKNCNYANNQEQKPKQFNKLSNRKSRNRKVHVLNLKVYQLLRTNKRQQLDTRRIEFKSETSRDEETRSQWLEFDVTNAVRAWLNKTHENLGIEIQCDKCRRIGARILSEVSKSDKDNEQEIPDKFHLTPVLNIIGHIGSTHSEEAEPIRLSSTNQSNQHFYHHHQHHNDHNDRKLNSCYRAHQRCCRHQLDVTFKDIKGFEFIIQPKTFDAGYCKGRCPPRHNPAHHHALLQGLIWQQDPQRAPRPCCAPSKLAEIEILHVDEEHSDKLKISTWSNMQVLECACS